jgi:PAS domain S-box-containing protein
MDSASQYRRFDSESESLYTVIQQQRTVLNKPQRDSQPPNFTNSKTSHSNSITYMQPPKHSGKETAAAEEQRELYAEQVKQLYSSGTLGLLASAINSLVLAVIQRDVTSRTALIAWVALLAVISMLRYSDIRAYWRRSPEASAAPHWGRRFTVGLALSGMAWGSSAIFLFPIESLAHQIFLAFVIGGMVAGATAAFSSVTTAFVAYSVPALSPIIIRFVLLRDEVHLAMGSMVLLFVVMMFFIARGINSVMIASVKLRFKNSGLITYLRERKLMEEALRENEEKYRNLVEQSLQGIFVIQDMRIVFSNQAFANMGGYPIQELYSFSPEEVMNIIHPDDRERVWRQYRERLQGIPSSGTYNELRALRKNGSIAWVEYTASSINYGGRPALQISIVDRSQRKEAEHALRESQSRLETVFAAIPDPILEYDASGRPVRANMAALKVAGLNSLTSAGDRALPMPEFRKLDGKAVRPENLPMSRALQGETVANDLYSVTTADGIERIVSMYAAPFHRDGNVNGVVALWHDVTELKQTEDALKKTRDELEERVKERTAELYSAYEVLQMEVEERRKVEKDLRSLTTAIEQAVEGFFVNGADGTIVYANKAFCRMLGYREEELIGQYIWSTRADGVSEKSARIWATINTGNLWTGRITRRRKDGLLIETETSVGPISDDNGTVVNQVGVCRDITEQLHLEARLRQAQKMEAVGTLAGGIAHDFNNILAAIIGFTEMAIEDAPKDGLLERSMENVLKAGLRGRDLIRQIMAFSRRSEGVREQVSLTPLIKETHALLRASLPSTITMNLVIDTTDDCVLADPSQLQQVLMNLVTNAAYAMRDDGGELTISLSSVTFSKGSLLPDADMKPGSYVKLTVQDTGTGMSEEVRQRIFEPFFTTKEPGKGTGMGLALAYGVVKSHGGTITVKSEMGQGSTFEVFLSQAQRAQAKEEEARSAALPTGTERILFVDDEVLLVEMAGRMLGDLGYHVTTACDGSEAWSLFLEDSSRFDLVITDQIMPDMTGLTLAQKMLRVRKEIPIILCTGNSEVVSAEKAQEVGIRVFMQKPVTKKDLAETIRQVLDGS